MSKGATNPIFHHADRLLKEVLFESEAIPAMAEIINGELHSYYCKDGQFGWYPITLEDFHALLWKRAINHERNQWGVG